MVAEQLAAAAASEGAARLVDFIFTVARAGVERGPYVDKARAMAAEGKSFDEITDSLQALRQEQDKGTQKKIDAMPG